MKVAIMGATNKTDRYAYQAFKLLREHGHEVYPVHPRLKEIEGVAVFPSLKEIQDRVDTITLYIGEDHSTAVAQDILSHKPRRIIFNPGAENPGLAEQAQRAGIEVQRGCTIVMLKTGQF